MVVDGFEDEDQLVAETRSRNREVIRPSFLDSLFSCKK
jgi:hypothetical protein